MSELEAEHRQLSVDLLRRSVEQGDELERLAREAHEIARVAIGQRDALAAVIEEARAWAASHRAGVGGFDCVQARDVDAILSRTPADVLVERDARIRAEVIDWFESRAVDRYDLNWVADARTRFGLTKGAGRG